MHTSPHLPKRPLYAHRGKHSGLGDKLFVLIYTRVKLSRLRQWLLWGSLTPLSLPMTAEAFLLLTATNKYRDLLRCVLFFCDGIITHFCAVVNENEQKYKNARKKQIIVFKNRRFILDLHIRRA
jgi:hypothetical protein